MLWALFDAPREALVYLSPTIKLEEDLTSSEYILHSWELPLGALLRAMLAISALRQCIQMLCYLDAELDFVVDFRLPSLVASSQPLRLLDGR